MRFLSWVIVVVTLVLPSHALAGGGLYPQLPAGIPELVLLVIVFGGGWLSAGRKGAVNVIKAKMETQMSVFQVEQSGEMERLRERITDTRSWVGSVSKRADERQKETTALIAEVREESATQKDVAHLQAQFDELRATVETLQSDVAAVKSDVADVKSDVAAVHADTGKILEVLENLGASHV